MFVAFHFHEESGRVSSNVEHKHFRRRIRLSHKRGFGYATGGARCLRSVLLPFLALIWFVLSLLGAADLRDGSRTFHLCLAVAGIALRVDSRHALCLHRVVSSPLWMVVSPRS